MNRPLFWKCCAISGLAAVMVLGSLLLGALPAAAQSYPRRPVELVVPWGAGGGTDAVARYLGAMLEKELGKPFNVVNRTGGSGVVGHSAIAFSKPDGYTIGLATVELTMMHWVGLTELTYKEVTPIALVNQDPAGLMVNVNSQWKTAKDLLDYVKANPGKLTGSGTGEGGIWHLALAGMLKADGLSPGAVRWVPSKGAAPALQDLIAGGVDVVTASLPEGKALIDAGRVRPLAQMGSARNQVFPDVPTLKEAVDLTWTTAAWRGIAAPKGTPKAIVDVLEKALDKIVHSEGYKDFLAKRGFGWDWANAADFGKFMADADASNGDVMKAAGIAK
jgi:tripartite-type tricarboxylate transporter receptor subunit TctC